MSAAIIHLQRVTMERLLVVADVLAKSVILAYDENRVARVFDRIEPVAERAAAGGGGRVVAAQSARTTSATC